MIVRLFGPWTRSKRAALAPDEAVRRNPTAGEPFDQGVGPEQVSRAMQAPSGSAIDRGRAGLWMTRCAGRRDRVRKRVRERVQDRVQDRVQKRLREREWMTDGVRT